jgi:hypothetical protein
MIHPFNCECGGGEEHKQNHVMYLDSEVYFRLICQYQKGLVRHPKCDWQREGYLTTEVARNRDCKVVYETPIDGEVTFQSPFTD